MDIIQGFIEKGNAGKSGWRIVNNKGAFGVVNKRTSNVSYSILNSGTIAAGSNFINTYSTTPAPTITASPSATTTGTTGNYTYQVFTYTTETAGAGTGQSQYTITVPTGGIVCDVLVVGGGGGGGMNAGAGGGAGGLILLQSTTLAAGNITIRVGDGGAGGQVSDVNTLASNGKNTIFGSYTAIAGGAGVNSGGANGNAGGSGGGAGNDMSGNRSGGAGTAGQGFKGGNGTIPGGGERTGGGGGGAGGEGQASVSSTRAGDGGVGRDMSSIFGTSVGQSGWFAGGGAGGVHSGTGGTGGTGGGGSENVAGINGTGGGGGAARSGSGVGRKGGSGIVIIRYLSASTSSSIALIQEPNLNVITNYVGGVTSSSSGGGSSQWTTIAGSKIYYNGGNVGIGTIDPIAPLHIYNNTTTATLPTEIVVAGATSATISGTTDRYISFPYSGSATTKDYTFTTTENLICDILIVGGGGAGGMQIGAGGGGGAVLYGTNINIPIGNYTIKVGKGAVPGEVRGGTSEAFGATLLGGGSVVNAVWATTNNSPNGNSGGSGGGGKGVQAGGTPGVGGTAGTSTKGTILNASTLYNGNIGGFGQSQGPGVSSGGGGGAGGVGGNGYNLMSGGNGGVGVPINITGTQYYWGAGGGAGCHEGIPGNGGLGGGGAGSTLNSTIGTYTGDVGGSGYGIASGKHAGNGTGSGGGGGHVQDNVAGNGGSGIVIIRYRRQTQPSVSNARLLLDATTTGTTAIEFRRGVGSDAQNDFRIINDTNSSLKLQCENTTQSFSDATANIAWFSSNETIIHKNTTMNGRVGIGTVYNTTIPSRTLDVVGDANISGILTAGSLSASSATITNSITSNTSLNIMNGFVTTLPNEIAVPSPIPNEIVVSPLPTEIVVAGTTFGTIGTTDRYISFPYSGTGATKDYTFTTTENLICDILVVGGGGSGSESHGGGGGAGAVIFMTNVTMNGGYTIKVGKGGLGGVSAGGLNGVGNKGNDSEIFKTNNISNKIVAEGGGGGGQFANANGGSGGSGGGGDAYNIATGVGGVANPYTPVLDGVTGIKYGNNGGNAFGNPGHGGGGGGAGGVGENALAICDSGNAELERAHGGIGIKSATINSVNYDFKTLFGTNTGAGVIEADGFLYFGGGGGNGRWQGAKLSGTEGGNGGLGGGGKGGWGGSGVDTVPNNGKGYPGINGTGGGGGGGADYTPAGGDGGSGIVIIRYRKPPSETVVSGTIAGTTDRYISFPYSGSAATKDYTITTTENLICDILIVGGGGGGSGTVGGGGGAGALIFAKNAILSNGTYTISVGSGGTGGASQSSPVLIATKGNSSSISKDGINITAEGGGASGRADGNQNGGSGGGGDYWEGNETAGTSTSYTSTAFGASIVKYGNNGANAYNTSPFNGGGGGGAGSSALKATSTNLFSNGGSGLHQVIIDGNTINFASIFGTAQVGGVLYNGNLYYGGGGGAGGQDQATGGTGGIGGGGNGGAGSSSTIPPYIPIHGSNGLPNTGGGGGGGSNHPSSGGAGGSGIIIIRYRKPPSETVTSSIISGTADRYIQFPYSGTAATKDYTITTTENLVCDILVVGGGGGGGRFGGGGGGGGVLLGTNLKISGGISVSIKVGNGGAGSTIASTGVNGVNGANSSIIFNSIEYIAVGGGGGGSRGSGNIGDNGSDGGSGGGGSGANVLPQGLGGSSNKNSYANFQSFGNSGGKGRPNSTGSQPEFASGGGGGAGSVGSDFTNATGGGNGGSGKDFIRYFGTGVGQSGWFGGGGGGQTYSGVGNAGNQGYGNGGNGLLGGGGNGGYDGTTPIPAVAGLANTGGGGGGGKEAGTGSNFGGSGGSGFVIIRYRKNQAQSSSFELITSSTTPIVEAQTFNVESIYPPYRYFTYNDTNGIYTVQNGSIEAGNSTNFSYTYSYNDPANTQGNNEQTSSTFKNTYGMGLYTFSVGGTQAAGGRSSGLFIYGLSSDYVISTSGNRPAVNIDDNQAALPNGPGWYVGTGWSNSTTYNSSLYYNTTFQGAWIKIELPIGIVFSSFKILGGFQKYRAPKAFKIYGSNTNTTTASDWTLLHTETNYTYNAGGDFGVKQTVTNNLMFKNYLMVVSEQHTYDGGLLVFQGWYIYGKEKLEPVVINSDYKYLSFTHSGGTETQTSYTVNFPESTLCDILVVGGGGGGGNDRGGGGGGGGVIYSQNITLNGAYTINVGKEGVGTTSGTGGGTGTRGTNGSNSSISGSNITTITAIGGGGGGACASGVIRDGLSGGSGGGGSQFNGAGSGGTGTSGQGRNGGIGFESGAGGGGGGAVNVGNDANSTNAGNGGLGLSNTITNSAVIYGSGGGGGGTSPLSYGGSIKLPGTGGSSGAGNGGGVNANGVNATIFGCGGGGGGVANGSVTTGGNGFAGVVIIRYKSTKSGNQTYKVGNYSGEFKVISSVSSQDTDYIKITSAGAITNPMGTASWNTGSDRRIKENIERASYDKCLDNINKLELNRFNYIDGFNTVNRDKTQLGFIAQEVSDIFPKSISSQEYYSNTLNIPDLLSIDITQINYSLYGAVKKLIEINIEKDIRIITLNNRIKILKNLLYITDDAYTSNIILGNDSGITDNLTSNLVIDANTSNIASNE